MAFGIQSPHSGTAVPLSEVADPVFSQMMVGPGIAIEPGAGEATAVSPIDGTVSTIKPHAVVITGEDGRGILIHLGIDTVNLHGEGFTVHAGKDQKVSAGDPLVTWNPDDIRARGLHAVIPVIALEAQPEDITEQAEGAVEAGEHLFTWN